MSISSVLHMAAYRDTPWFPECLAHWFPANADNAYRFAREMTGNFQLFMLSNMTDAERRMYLLFLSMAAEDEGK